MTESIRAQSSSAEAVGIPTSGATGYLSAAGAYVQFLL
jgi:hypothetical protein